jgi:hypothetical protein
MGQAAGGPPLLDTVDFDGLPAELKRPGLSHKEREAAARHVVLSWRCVGVGMGSRGDRSTCSDGRAWAWAAGAIEAHAVHFVVGRHLSAKRCCNQAWLSVT